VKADKDIRDKKTWWGGENGMGCISRRLFFKPWSAI